MDGADVKSMTFTELSDTLSAHKLPPYRAKQVFNWLQEKGAFSFDEMSNLPKALRALLAKAYTIPVCNILKKQVSKQDGTIKYLFALSDGALIESVLMQHHHGYSLCVSSQVGCRMGCHFCASAKGGFVRNLTAGEMLGQIHRAQTDSGNRVSHIVLMGMGEPLDNFDNVLRFVQLATDKDGLNRSMRHITLSTCGLVDKMAALLNAHLGLTLSVSLHAPNDATREKLMPINRRYPLAELMPACRQYAKQSGRRISFEYAMLHNTNDTDADAEQLAALLQGMLCHVNLIPGNPVANSVYQPSTPKQIQRFQNILTQNGIPTTVRRTLGADIDASCGQLRLRALADGNTSYRESGFA